jgi:DNA-binding PadR family transcriptional regulator
MKFDFIYQFFRDPPPIYLNKELAICYILSALLQGDAYGSELMKQLEREFPVYRLSDTVLHGALHFLEKEMVIKGYWKKRPGRGRPRKMYCIIPESRHQAQELAGLWYEYIHGRKWHLEEFGLESQIR